MNNILRHTLAVKAAKRGIASAAPVRPMGIAGNAVPKPRVKLLR